MFPKIEVEKKTDDASESFNENNLISRALKKVLKEFPDLMIICDVALDPYTTSGHDGIINSNGEIDNDITVQILVKMSLNLASSGCKIIAPSDMMDGRIKIIRENLETNKFSNVNILSYSSKFCSNFYSPFRDALGSKENLGDSKKDSYQIDYRNSREAVKESLEDIEEGADIVMVKPAGYYLDIINEIKKNCLIPVAAYQVSGEYVMIKNASDDKFIDYRPCVLESLSCIKRAGADVIFSYFSKEVAEWLK
ncbi:MAG: delta-aminolevulinic acid dehydratase [Alphaproteobacteria bacterium]|nr:MAG: delta-aminolevulinic acid dehydratase [Alphaproteobacteria bacterium]